MGLNKSSEQKKSNVKAAFKPTPTRGTFFCGASFRDLCRVEPNYETDSSKIVLRQLGKAGFRLAALLTAVFESQ